MNRKSVAGHNQFYESPMQNVDSTENSDIGKFNLGSIISNLVKKTSIVQGKLVPGWSDSKIDNLLFEPKNKVKFASRAPKGFREEAINTKDGVVQAYMTGSGPLVVFVHGWGGHAFQFMPLMRGLARCGYTALAFDLLGHGQSEPRQTTIQQSISTTSEVLQYLRKNTGNEIAAIVGHSTGCISVANSNKSLIKNAPLFLIAPIFNYKLYFLKRLVELKLPARVVKPYVARFNRIYKKDYEKLALARHLARYDDATVIAHDESDAETAIGDSVKFCSKHPLTRLLVTKKSDHDRIITSESVWQELKATLNYDDTTISFSELVFKR